MPKVTQLVKRQANVTKYMQCTHWCTVWPLSLGSNYNSCYWVHSASSERHSSAFHESWHVFTFGEKVVFKLGVWLVTCEIKLQHCKRKASEGRAEWCIVISVNQIHVSRQLPLLLPQILGQKIFILFYFLHSDHFPAHWNSLLNFWEKRVMIIYLRQGLWFYSLRLLTMLQVIYFIFS